MEWSTIAALILAMSGVVTLLVSSLYRRQDVGVRIEERGAKRLMDALQPVFEALARHDRDHAKHYETANVVLRLSQQVSEQEKRNDDRFDEIREMNREMRDDIKELLTRKREYPK